MKLNINGCSVVVGRRCRPFNRLLLLLLAPSFLIVANNFSAHSFRARHRWSALCEHNCVMVRKSTVRTSHCSFHRAGSTNLITVIINVINCVCQRVDEKIK